MAWQRAQWVASSACPCCLSSASPCARAGETANGSAKISSDRMIVVSIGASSVGVAGRAGIANEIEQRVVQEWLLDYRHVDRGSTAGESRVRGAGYEDGGRCEGALAQFDDQVD